MILIIFILGKETKRKGGINSIYYVYTIKTDTFMLSSYNPPFENTVYIFTYVLSLSFLVKDLIDPSKFL